MNKYYSKFTKKDNYKNRQYNHKKNYNYKRNQYNYNYTPYYKKKNISYENEYEEEISFDRETIESIKAPTTVESTSSQNSNSCSRRQSINENNNKDSSIIIIDNNKTEEEIQQKKELIPKINLSENELKSAYYKPKNYKSNILTKNQINIKEENENTVILEIEVKISNDKKIYFKLRKYDDMFQIVKEVCEKNEISEKFTNFFVYKIIKALNSIYGIYNIILKEEEIRFLQQLKNQM